MRGVQFLGHVADQADALFLYLFQRLRHLIKVGGHHRQFVAAGHGHPLAVAAVGDALAAGRDLLQGAQDLPRQQQAADQTGDNRPQSGHEHGRKDRIAKCVQERRRRPCHRFRILRLGQAGDARL